MAAEPAADKPFLLYGANGYTGELVAESCARDGVPVILAGRREEAIRPVAERLGLPWRVFPLDTGAEVARHLGDVSAVLLAAGPFSHTSAPMVDGCLRASVCYIDVTGEIAVFEAVHARDAEAKKAGVALLPGAGFDVVPSDCLAKALSDALPGADRLFLAFRGIGSPSRGTMKTSLEGLANGGAVRRDGRIVRVPMAYRRRIVPFHDKPRAATTVPWGDVSTAFYSTGIPDIEVYMALPPRMITAIRLSRPLAPLLANERVQRFMKARVESRAPGPSAAERARGRSELWGRVEAGARSVEGTLTAPEGYELTVMTAIESTRRLGRGEVEPGAKTPSLAFGASFIEGFEGCEMRVGAPS